MKNYSSKIILAFLILTLCFALSPQGLWAQTPAPNKNGPQLATSVSEVRTMGYWEKGERHGTYRVIIINDGWEHIRSQVYIQAIQEAEDPNQDDLVLSAIPVKEINDPNIWSVSILKTGVLNKKIVIDLNGINTYSSSEKKHFRLTLLEPGKYQLSD